MHEAMREFSVAKLAFTLSLLILPPTFLVASDAYIPNTHYGLLHGSFPTRINKKNHPLPTRPGVKDNNDVVSLYVSNIRNYMNTLITRYTNSSSDIFTISKVAKSAEQKHTITDEFSIRNARFKDLSKVSAILVESFYKPSFFKHYHLTRELDRLQSNFPYGDDKHSMYVASDNNNNVVGFCDLDGRPKSSNINAVSTPRPYLSDLAVDPKWRRRGIARALIHKCEQNAIRLGFHHIYLRVKFDNEPAILMYAEMGYDIMMDDYYLPYDDTILLRKEFTTAATDSNYII
mmetsp:Transcript_26186/g.37548  ORF Transcript_26186/g.37548 Transcript_26186/m.37548 type:complete len:289 (-) Transcript_26186:182-1048(-)